MLHLARYSSITPADFDRALGITVGFDSMFDRLFGDIQRTETASGYPPYNIRKDDEEKYTIEMAVAGFTDSDISVVLKDSKLTVEGKVEDKDEKKKHLYKGIANRSFKRDFTLADTIEVEGADLENGILLISLKNIIPDHKKPKTIKSNLFSIVKVAKKTSATVEMNASS